MAKRLISKKQEQALRLCHQDFDGLDQEKAANIMGISRRALGKLLAAVEKVFPQYFPILTKHEAKIYHYYMIEGWKVNEISEHTGLTKNAVYKTLHRTRNKGMYFTKAKGKLLSYNPDMDIKIKQKF